MSCARDLDGLSWQERLGSRALIGDVDVARRRCASPKEVQMPYTFTLTATIPASPEEIYQAWLDSIGHSEMTGGEAEMSDLVGAEVSAWDGYISGRNLELVPGERIVQSWRTSEFGNEQEDSVITVVLQEIGGVTLLTLEHSNVPDEHRSYEEGGWQSNYFEPMVAYFSERKDGVAEPAPQKTRQKGAPKKSAAKASPKNAAKRPAKSARKAKRTARAKPKRAASPTKTSPKKSKSRIKAKTRSKIARKPAKPPARKRAKPGARKTSRRKRR
jgi:uncharacterized protein YndB with AHSA1/START domain